MLYKISTAVGEIPPLFCELDELSRSNTNNSEYWKERARWIRFEEQAEDVLGRWSKPHVATLPQTSIDDLKELLQHGVVMLNEELCDMPKIADAMANELLLSNYFKEMDHAKRFAEVMCLPHIHHHEKQLKKSASGLSLVKSSSQSNFNAMKINRSGSNLSQLSTNPNTLKTNNFKYRHSFVDSVALEEFSSNSDFKENMKFKKKINERTEGASILIAPVDFVSTPKLVFLRFEAATELTGFLEVTVKSRFIVVIIGSQDKHIQLYEIGRAMATCFADDLCKELVYAAATKDDIIQAINQFSRSTMVIPPSEWDPKIQIEPPEKFMSKEERMAVQDELAVYMHDKESEMNSSHSDPQLECSKRPFDGLIKDIKRKMPYYVSDLTDCLNIQCIATTLYMYLVSLCSLVAFGALLSQNTDNYMATMECILAGAVCGVIYSLFSGQPLSILSATGPMIILENIIKNLCNKYGINSYMEFRMWIGIWTTVMLLLLVMFNLSFLVKYITRFTEESFASLVAVMFIMDAMKSLFSIRKKYPYDPKLVKNISTMATMPNLNSTECRCDLDLLKEIEKKFNETLSAVDKSELINGACNCTPIDHKQAGSPYAPNVYFFSIILFLLTFQICVLLKKMRNKNYFPSKIRQIIGDFSVLIAIVVVSGIDKYVGINTPKLEVPTKVQPTRERSWIVPFFSGQNEWYTIVIAIIPALVSTILIFMDQQITAVIINRKEYKLKKSYGYHLDLLVIAICILTCSILGLPWFVAATVLALTHINSLKVTSTNNAPGERPTFLGVKEQRVSSFLMSLLIGLSVFFTSFLKFIPLPVLYGVFLFMGVNALRGIQFVDRVLILLMPTKYQPDFPYLKHVSTKRVHLFTLIECVTIIALYLVKYIESIAISFPILILATCGIRKLLECVFTSRELLWLDDLLPGQHINSDNKGAKKRSNNKCLKKLLCRKNGSSIDETEEQPCYDSSLKCENNTIVSSNETVTNNTAFTTINTTANNNSFENKKKVINNSIPVIYVDDVNANCSNNNNNNNSNINYNNSNNNNNNNNNINSDKYTPTTQVTTNNPVKFVTHFPDIKEDES